MKEWPNRHKVKLFTRVTLRTETSTVVVVSRWLWKVIKLRFFGPIMEVGLPYMGYIGMCSWVEGIIFCTCDREIGCLIVPAQGRNAQLNKNLINELLSILCVMH